MQFLYIHGFNSSPASYKSRYFRQFLQDQHPQHSFTCPELSDYPAEAMAQLTGIIEQNLPDIALLGSSLGGFYATFLALKYHLNAALINPAVNPHQLLKPLLGKNTNYHSGREYDFTLEHIEQLKDLLVDEISAPELFMVLLQSGDEVLDYRLAEQKYRQTKLIVEQGGNHSFENFEKYCEPVYQFLLSNRKPF